MVVHTSLSSDFVPDRRPRMTSLQGPIHIVALTMNTSCGSTPKHDTSGVSGTGSPAQKTRTSPSPPLPCARMREALPARDLVKIDVNETSRVCDLLVEAGFLKTGNVNVQATAGAAAAGSQNGHWGCANEVRTARRTCRLFLSSSIEHILTRG